MMKHVKYISIVLLFGMLFSGFVSGLNDESGEIRWYDWNEGIKKARSEGKVAIIDTYTDWCHWCKVMDRNTYGNKTIIELVGKDFIPIKFNPELNLKYINGTDTLNGRQLLAALSGGSASGYPTTYFYLTRKNVMYQEAGYIEPVQFENILKGMLAENSK